MTIVGVISSSGARIDDCVKLLLKRLDEEGYAIYTAKDYPHDPPTRRRIKDMIGKVDHLILVMSKEESVFVFQAAAYAKEDAKIIRLVEFGAKDDRLGLEEAENRVVFERASFSDAVDRAIAALESVTAVPVASDSGSPDDLLTQLDYARIRDPARAGDGPSPGVHVAASPLPPDWYKELGPVLKMTADDICSNLRFGSTWVISRQRFRESGKTRWITAVVDEQTKFILSWKVTYRIPSPRIVSLLCVAAQHAAGVPDVIKCDLHDADIERLKKILAHRSGFMQKRPEYLKLDDGLAWLEDYLEAVIKKTTAYEHRIGSHGVDLLADYEIISHNFIQQPYLDDIPADLAGFERVFDGIDKMLGYAMTTQKYVLAKLANLVPHIVIHKHITRDRIVIKVKHGLDADLRRRIESALEELKLKRKGRSWMYRFSFRSRHRASKSPYPYNLFEICNKCHTVSYSTQDVVINHGMRYGNTATQPCCKTCRGGNDEGSSSTLDSFINPGSGSSRTNDSDSGSDTSGSRPLRRARRRKSTQKPSGVRRIRDDGRTNTRVLVANEDLARVRWRQTLITDPSFMDASA
ncbi:MAG: hypothetical protein MPJ08_00955 [Nitrosopumilus sp.]|nr:hypothetical protein [Nitrosopumilus sp.]